MKYMGEPFLPPTNYVKRKHLQAIHSSIIKHLYQKHFHDYFKVLLLMSKDDNLPLSKNEMTTQNTEGKLHACKYVK